MDVQQATATSSVDQSSTSLIFHRDAENPAVCVVDGYGIKITTRSGRLVVSDGIGRQRRERTYNRATHGLSRLVVMATTGHVTVEAYRWLDQLGIGFTMLDPSTGEVTSATTRVANDDARLRRAQALALGTTTGLVIARYLIGLKLAGEAAIAREELASPEEAETILRIAGAVDQSSTLEEVRQLEASAANLYWSSWGRVEATFVKADATRVPANWLRMEGRRSAIHPGSARHATDPINACLNISFRLLEAEGHLATMAVGLDPGIGVLHADVKGRASFVLDLIEAARPMAELHVLRLLQARPLRWRDFHENAKGVVRVLPPLTHRLAEGMPGYAATLAPVVEHVARLLAEASPYDVAMPSTLTREKHKAAARRRVDWVKGMPSPVGPAHPGMSPRKKSRQKAPAEHEPALPLPICKGCGVALAPEPDRPRRRGAYCPACLAQRRKELGASLASQSARTSADLVVRTGARPTHTHEAKVARQAGNATQRAEQSAWEAEHAGEAHDPAWFTRAVLPGLQGMSLTDIAKATGMSTSTASKVRAGRRVPHPRHWEALQGLGHPLDVGTSL
ncbi:MAG: CRISPR-associated endonuclease Cas1 [Acidimicrobiales bacterium]